MTQDTDLALSLLEEAIFIEQDSAPRSTSPDLCREASNAIYRLTAQVEMLQGERDEAIWRIPTEQTTNDEDR